MKSLFAWLRFFLLLCVLCMAEQSQARAADVFLQTEVDTPRPWVQQSVGYVVRLYAAVPVLGGRIEQDAPTGASLRQVGDDVQFSATLNGRLYRVFERRYLLVPERSGAVRIPPARFTGTTTASTFDRWFGSGETRLQAQSMGQQLQVQAIAENAPEPWLPLQAARLEWASAPAAGQIGKVTEVEIIAFADGATAAQLPDLQWPAQPGVQVFAEPVQVEEGFSQGRPHVLLRRRYSLLAEQAGTIALVGPQLTWWDAQHGQARVAQLPPVQWQVQPSQAAALSAQGAGLADDAALQESTSARWQILLAAALIPALGAALWLYRRRVQSADAVLQKALQHDDLLAIEAGIYASLSEKTGQPVQAVAALAHLESAAQRQALQELQHARWRTTAPPAALLKRLRVAFARGVQPVRARAQKKTLLPPLYPQ